MLDSTVSRPNITEQTSPVEILRAMLTYRRKSEKSFSVMRACAELYRVSPALVTLILNGKRKITRDRVDELATLMGLTPPEKTYFRNLVIGSGPAHGAMKSDARAHEPKRKSVTTHILSDWLNVYVKDCFQIKAVQKNPDILYRQLGPLASNARIQKSMEFLLREGHLRRTMDGKIVPETNLTVTDPGIPSIKIRQFHKAALKVAHQAIDLHAFHERFANTLLVSLSPERYQQFLTMIKEFAERLQEFAEQNDPESDRLYQLVINLSPTGGKVE